MDYAWAKNKIKLQLAIDLVKSATKLDSSISFDEETIKAKYVSMAGKVVDATEEAAEQEVEQAPKKRARKSK